MYVDDSETTVRGASPTYPAADGDGFGLGGDARGMRPVALAACTP
jgi:hypothetical protein